MARRWSVTRAESMTGIFTVTAMLTLPAAVLCEEHARLGAFAGHADVGSPRIAGAWSPDSTMLAFVSDTDAY